MVGVEAAGVGVTVGAGVAEGAAWKDAAVGVAGEVVIGFIRRFILFWCDPTGARRKHCMARARHFRGALTQPL